jgi:hypothetical protein
MEPKMYWYVVSYGTRTEISPFHIISFSLSQYRSLSHCFRRHLVFSVEYRIKEALVCVCVCVNKTNRHPFIDPPPLASHQQ